MKKLSCALQLQISVHQDIWNHALCDVQNVCAWAKVGTILNQPCLATVSLHIVLIRWNNALYLLLKNHHFVCEHHLDCGTICKRNVWHNNSIFPTILFFTDGMIENCANSICISRQFEYVSDPSQMRRGPTGTDRRTLTLATSDYFAVSRRYIRTRL